MFSNIDSRFCPSLTNIILSSVAMSQRHFLTPAPSYEPEFIFKHNYILFNPAKYSRTEYLDAWPEDLNYPIWTANVSSYESTCAPKAIVLPYMSEFYGIRAKVLVNSCAEYEDYAEYIDMWLTARDRYFYDYRIFDVAKQEFYSSFGVNREAPIDRSLYRMYEAAYQGQKVVQDYQSLQCECDATSYIPAIRHACLSAWHLINKSENTDEDKDAVERWLLEICDLFLNLSVSKLVMTFLKVLREFVPLTVMLDKVISMINYCVYTITGKSSQQQGLGGEPVESSSLDLEAKLAGLAQFPADNIHIAAAISAVIVLISSTLVGVNICKFDHQKSIALKLSSVMSSIAKCKSGIYAVIAMFTDLTKWIHVSMKDLLMSSSQDAVVSLIAQTTVPESDECQKDKFYEYLDFIVNPQNLLLLQRNKTYKLQVDFVYKILSEIITNLAKQDLKHVSVSMRDYLKVTFTDVKKVRDVVFRRPLGDTIRFTPFWVNILGPSRCGKSVLQPFISNVLFKALKRYSEYEVPDKDHWQYAVNFSDKFLTDYNGEYLLLIDDFLQDASPIGDRSSCMDMISWVSSIPYKTNQAGLADKGTPFDSKIIISSSNDRNMKRKEIVNAEALRLRQAMRVHFDPDESVEPDPVLGGKRVSITLCDSNSGALIRKYKCAMEFISDVIIKYKKHYAEQKKIIESRQVNDDVMAQIDAFENEGTSLIGRVKCRLGMNPPTKIINQVFASFEQYECECEYHRKLNGDYFDFVAANAEVNNYRFCGINEFSFPVDRHMSYRETFHGYLSIIAEKISNLWQNKSFKLIASFIGAITVFVAGKAIVNLTGNVKVKEDTETPETKEDGILEYSAAQYALKVKRLKTDLASTSEDIRKESSASQTYELVNNVFINRGIVCMVENLQTGEIATALRIGGRALLLNHHFTTALKNGDKFVVKIWHPYSGLQQTEQQFDPQQCHRIGTKDVVVYNCDAALAMARNITNHFPDALVKVATHKAMVVAAHPSTRILTNVIANPVLHASSYDVREEVYDTLDSYKTNCEVEKGMSGSVLISCEDTVPNKILGIQICRSKSDGKGFFISVSRPELESALESLQITPIVELDKAKESTSFVPDDSCPPNLKDGNLLYMGTLPKNKYVRQQIKSKIIPSLIQREPLTQQPSVLSDHSTRMDESLRGKSVIFRSIEGFAKPIGSIDRPTLRRALDDYKIEYDVVLEDPLIARRLLDDNEMINGIPGVINRVEMKTSPGYPFVLQREKTTIGGKYEWFNEVTPLPGYGKTYVMTEKLKGGLEQREKYMLAGVNPGIIAYACLKDETRPLEKIRTGSTRAFICLPLDYNLLIRKYFGAFIASLHKQAGNVASCVGIDPATQWKDLYDKLAAKNLKWEDFDYKNWDQHLHPELVMSVASLVNYWYGDMDESPKGRLRSMLLHDLIFTTVIVKDRLFRKSSGQCSGCAITAELNSVVHDLLMYYVWLKMNNDFNRPTTLTEFRDYIAYAIYGDDIIKAMRSDCPIPFDGSHIKDYMVELGMNITPGDKKSIEFVTKDPSEILFLKRSFRRDGFFVKAPLRPDIVENIPQWIHKSDKLNAADATVMNCETMLREAYMHGREYFHEQLVSINGRIKDYNNEKQGRLPPVIMSYSGLDSLYRECKYTCAGLEWKARAEFVEEH